MSETKTKVRKRAIETFQIWARESVGDQETNASTKRLLFCTYIAGAIDTARELEPMAAMILLQIFEDVFTSDRDDEEIVKEFDWS